MKSVYSRRATAIGAALATAVAVLGGVAVAAYGDDGSGGGGSAPEGLVITAEAQRRTLRDSVTVKGTLERVEQRQVDAVANGQVSAVHVEDGATVNEGDAVLALDGRDAVAVPGEFPFFRALDVGSKGADVRQLEQVLAAAGYSPGPVDDSYTEQTRAALAQWQAAHGYPGATPEQAETVTVTLQQSGAYDIGDRNAAGVTIGPSAPTVRAASVDEAVTFEAAGSGNPLLSITALNDVTAEGQPARFRIDLDDMTTTKLEVKLVYGGSVGTGDYAGVAVVEIPVNAWAATFEVPVRQDRIVEPKESLTASLVAGTSYRVGEVMTAHTVIVDDDLPELRLSGSARVAEGDTAVVTVVADQAPVQDVAVALSLTGDASPGTDLQRLSPVVLLRAGAITVDVPVVTLVDDVVEQDERAVVGIATGAAYAVGSQGSAVVTIAGGDGIVPTITVRPTATHVAEGQPVPLAVALDRPTDVDIVLDLGFAGTAVPGDDITLLGRTVVPAGTTWLQLSVPTVQDDLVEGDRTLVVTLAPNPRYRIGAASGGTTTIESDDVPELTLLGGGQALAEGRGTSFTIVADQAPVEDLSVAYTVLGSATQGDDFAALTGTALLQAGQTQVVVPLLTVADDVSFLPTDMVAGQWPIRVGQLLVDAGESVQPATPLFSLTDSGLTVTLRASASDRTKLQPGQAVTVSLTGGSEEAQGVIGTLDDNASVDEATGDQFYEGTVDVGELAAADGASVTIEVVLEERVDAVTVPIAAVKQDGQGRDVVRVLDLEDGGSVREVPVRTGIAEGSYLEVVEGLEGGEVVVVEVEAGP